MRKNEVIEHYSRLLAEHGPTFRSGDHGSDETRALRYRVLTEVTGTRIFGFNSVLEVGCGIAELSRSVLNYTGWDIAPDLIAAAYEYNRPFDLGRRYEVRDLYESTEREAYDYVVASGLFQFSDYHELRLGVSRMWGLCRKAVAFNALTKTDGTPGEHSHNPLTLLSFAMTLTPKVVLRTDYLSNDVTCYLYR